MTIKVFSNLATHTYPDSTGYHIDDEGRLHIKGKSGNIASHSRLGWTSVENVRPIETFGDGATERMYDDGHDADHLLRIVGMTDEVGALIAIDVPGVDRSATFALTGPDVDALIADLTEIRDGK